jgi:hypothetical protein
MPTGGDHRRLEQDHDQHPQPDRVVTRLDQHEKTYGHRAGADEPVELVSIQVVGLGLREGPNVPERVRASSWRDSRTRRRRQYHHRARVEKANGVVFSHETVE